MDDFFVTNNCKNNIEKIATRTNVLLGLFTTFKVIETVTFQENVLQEYYKNAGGPWFDVFMQKTLLRQITIRIKSLTLLFFDLLKIHVICIYLYKPLMAFLNYILIMFLG